MLFTTGDFITLGIVLVVLLVYRQLDRDNRSLEKVKRFADRIRDELSAYVDKRSEDLQRFGIELDVQQKAAKVALDRIQAVQAGLAERADAIDGIEKRLGEYDAALARLKEMTARVDENLARLRDESDFTDSVAKRLESAQKGMELIQRELPALKESFAVDSAAALEGFKQQLLADVSKRLAEATETAARARDEARNSLQSLESGKAAIDRELAKGLERARVEAGKLEDAAFARLKEGTEAKAARLKELMEEKFSQLAALAKERATETQGVVKAFKAEWKAETDEAEARLAALRAEREAAVAKAHNDRDVLEARLAADGAALQERLLGEFERRAAEHGSEIDARLERLEAAGSGLAALDQALRASMDDATRRVEGELEASARALDDRRARFEESFSAEAERLRGGMRAVEEELERLKSRAYENVSEKLKVFEDEFFADLKSRSESVDARLESWRADLDTTLADISGRTAAERAAAEKALTEETRARLAEAQARAQEQAEKMRERVEAMADGIQAQSGMASESLAALKESVLKDAADARATAQAYVEGEISRFSLEVSGRVKAAERELESFAATTTALIGKARSEYEDERDALAASSQAERDRISKELAGLAERTAELRSDLSTRIAQALDGFTRGYDALSADIERKRREAQAEADLRLREYKDAVQDLGAKIEAQRAQAFGRVESEASRIAQSVAEIDKEQKAFLAQTKVFERADELRESLAASIESMTADLSRLEGRRAEVAEIEGQLSRVKRLEDEVNQKVSRFLAEKKRIDALEADFAKLAEVSETVDRRLDEVTGQSDALTEAQAAIRKVLELSKEAEAKYERLEKKSGVLDATVEAVDKNFQAVQSVEKTVAAVGAELKRLPDRVTEIRRSVDALAADKERVDEAVGKLSGLGQAIAEAEKRIAEVQKAREWIARSETRLEEIDRRAQEQLKLLSSLLKDEEGTGSRRERGAPPSSAQDTVRKLARQGWNVDEIARAVKISRGEVELILELGVKK